MKERVYIYFSLLASALLVVLTAGCSKKNLDNDLPYITFGVAGVDASTKADTKGLITNSNLPNQQVYVYGVRNNTTKIFDNVQISKEQDNNNWNVPGASKRQWVQGSSYSFYGYSFSSPQTTDASVTISNSGLKIEVTQPDEYIENNMVDYMLSHAYKVADGSNYHVVMLYMQHAMAWVEIVVKKQMSDHDITLNSIALNNIFRSATMQCEYQAIANKGESNVWLTNLSGGNDQDYTKLSPDFTKEGDFILGRMSILAVPQQLYSETVLNVGYTVDENGSSAGGEKAYTESFQLFNYIPYVWEPGHKITYTLTINTGVELKADISDWKEAGYTEGIILPPVNSGSGSEGAGEGPGGGVS